MRPREISCCRACGNSSLLPVLSLGNQSLTGVFPSTRDEPVMVGPLELVRCDPAENSGCGLLQLRHSYPAAAMYGDNYGYRSGLNRSMVDHLRRKTRRLLELVRPDPGVLLLDIGSNDGTLLNSYPGVFRRVGMDPVARKFLGFYDGGIEIITDFFSQENWSSRFGDQRAEIITSIAMFYDLESPLDFVRQIAETLSPTGVWHFEQSYMPLMVRQLAYDTICHEHIEYYALRQICWLLNQAGLKIVDLEVSMVNGGSLAVTAAHAGAPYPEAVEQMQRMLDTERAEGFESMEPLEKFAGRVLAHREGLIAVMRDLQRDGKKVLGYGASTKGNVLLQYCGFGPDDLAVIGEVNEEKFGRFTPGTAIPIVSERDMHALNPDVLLVLPWHFRDNLIAREAEFLSRGGRLLFPLPEIAFVSGSERR